MAAFKPAYLIRGDDHGRIGERRARLRALAHDASGAQGAELLEGEAATPDAVAATLSAMTFAIGRRFVVIDGVERWKDKGLESLQSALAALAPDTTVVFFAREDGRLKAPVRLAEAVRQAGGDVAAEMTLKAWELPKWAAERARELGLQLEPEAARALVAHVGERQQRLLRELEKLELELGPRGRVGAAEVLDLTAASAERKAWALADAIVAGEAGAAMDVYLALRAQGERVAGLIYWVAQRLRTALEVAEAVESGEPAGQIKRRLRMPGRAAERLIGDVQRTGSATLRRAIEETADLELASRGGGSSPCADDTAMMLMIERIAA